MGPGRLRAHERGSPGARTETEARVENCVFEGHDVSLQRGTRIPLPLLCSVAGQIIQGKTGTRLDS